MSKVRYSNALGLDLGDSKIGVARINSIARIPQPLGSFKNDESLVKILKDMISEFDIDILVVGVPRNMSGKLTEQSAKLNEQAKSLSSDLGLGIAMQDETLSSLRAQDYINKTGIHSDEDSIAACIILEDFAEEQAQGLVQ